MPAHSSGAAAARSCRVCDPCVHELESYCEAGATPAYDGVDRVDGTPTLLV
jgi:alcohol dehydrogenase (NADP+)